MNEARDLEVMRDDGEDVEHERGLAPVPLAAALQQADVMAQLDAAHRYGRSITRFLREAESLVTMDQDIAASCMYAVPRGGKLIEGPSVRLAEIAASCWGNLQVGARPVEMGEKTVTCEGVAWDMERNVRYALRVERRITGSAAKRDDMAALAAAAGNSIALRNAIFRVIPRTYIDRLYAAARKVAVGSQKTLVDRRMEFMARIAKAGVTQDRVFARLEVTGIDDITLEQLATLVGLGTAIREGTITIDEAFPPVTPTAAVASAPQGQRFAIGRTPPVTVESPPAESATQSAPAATRTPGQRCALLGQRLGLSDIEQRRCVESVTGKSSRASVTDARFAEVEQAMRALAAQKAAQARTDAPAERMVEPTGEAVSADDIPEPPEVWGPKQRE